MSQSKTSMLNAWLNTIADEGPVREATIRPSRKRSLYCDGCPEDAPTVLAIIFGTVGTRRLCMKCARKHAEKLK